MAKDSTRLNKSKKLRNLERSGCGYRYRWQKRYWKNKRKREKKAAQKKAKNIFIDIILLLLFIAIMAGLAAINL